MPAPVGAVTRVWPRPAGQPSRGPERPQEAREVDGAWGHFTRRQTIAFMFMLQILATNLRGLTGGSQGLGYPVPQGWSPDFVDVPFYWAMLALAALALAASWGIRRSRLGLGLLAIRDDEDRALAHGVPAWGWKLAAFAMAARDLALRPDQIEDVHNLQALRVEEIGKIVTSCQGFEKIKEQLAATQPTANQNPAGPRSETKRITE